MAKRLYAEIKMFDYTDMEEFNMHKEYMREKGFKLIDNDMFGGQLQTGRVNGSEKYKWTACYIKAEGM